MYDRNAGRLPDDEEEERAFDQLDEIRDELGSRGLPLPRAWAVLESESIDATEYALVAQTIERVRAVLDRWIDDPESVAADIALPPDSVVEPRD